MTKTFKQIREIDVPKGHEYGPSSRKRPAGKAGYTSSDSARTTHLKTIKKWSKKKRRQGDKEFANESMIDNVKKAVEIAKKMAGNMTGAAKEIEKIQKGLSKHIRVADALRLANEEVKEEVRGSLFKKGAKVKYVGDNPRYKGKTGTVANVHGTEDNVKYAITGFLKGTLAITLGAGDIRYAYQQREEAPANATGTAVAGTGDDSSTVVVKKKKEQQSKLMRRIKDSIDKAIPDIKKEEDEIITRKNQLKELAKNRNV